MPGLWRTLTSAEMTYILNTRPDAASKKATASVAGVPGTILLPDDWELPSGLTFTAANYSTSAPVNVYTAAQWQSMEANGIADQRWGWGKIDALAAINEAISRVGIRQAEEQSLPLQLWPNPATDIVNVNTGCGESQLLQVYSVTGRCMLETPVQTQTSFSTTGWAQGVYIVRVGSRTTKLIVR